VIKPLVTAALLGLAGCSAISQATQKPPYVTGQWGGEHIGLTVEGGGARIEYDCAAGTIDDWILPGKDGRFRVEGRHIPGRGGPVRVGEIFRSYRATYTGTVTKDVMELSVTLEGGEMLGPFTLTRGAVPQLTRCL